MLNDGEAKLLASLSEQDRQLAQQWVHGPFESARPDRASINLADPTLRETLTASPRVEVCDARIQSRRVISALSQIAHYTAKIKSIDVGGHQLRRLSPALARVTIGQKHGRGTKPTCNGVLTI
jgi:hypothetical protein